MNPNFVKIYENKDVIRTADLPTFDGEAANGTLLLSFTYKEAYAVRIYLRHVHSVEEVLFEDRVYECKITRLSDDIIGTVISEQFDIVFAAIDQIVDKIRTDAMQLGGGKHLRSKKRFDNVMMMIRIIPNFLHDGSNLHSPPMPLFLNLHRTGGHMDKWFTQLMRALQSAQAAKTPLDPILRFLGTNQESVDISITLLGLDRTERLIENRFRKKYTDYFKDVEQWRIGGRIIKTNFAMQHTMNTELVQLYDHEFIPGKVFMSFPQRLDKRISNGCLLLSVIACYIQTMTVNAQQYQASTQQNSGKKKSKKG